MPSRGNIPAHASRLRYRLITNLVNCFAASGLAKPFGGAVRDIELHQHQVNHANRHSIKTMSSYIVPSDIDVFALRHDGSIVGGHVEGKASADVIYAWIKAKFGNDHVSKLGSSAYSKCCVELLDSDARNPKSQD
jgi:hypothetical protein